MRYYFAPMEGLTDRVYRRLHHKYFAGADKYFMPFLSPTVHRALTPREVLELPMADSEGFRAVPQLLTKNSADFLWMAGVCRDRGYGEVNLNLGCPSGTVVAKGKGSGMLRDLEGLDRFLEEVYGASPLPISVKTRLGLEDREEFPALLEIFNRYPIKELTVHPRLRKQFYTGEADREMFRYAVEHSRNPLCYNGDITGLSQAEALHREYPGVEAVMIGRGLIARPWLLAGEPDKRAVEAFLNELLDSYAAEFGGVRNAMFRMKEHWGMLHGSFRDSEKLWKKLRKTTDVGEFRAVSRAFFEECEMG